MPDPVNLLDSFALVSTQVVKLHAELHRTPPSDAAVQAHVEIKLTPGKGTASGRSRYPVYRVGVGLICQGVTRGENAEEDPVFTIECRLDAGYQQISGDPIAYELFSTSHASLTRQLYPLIHHQLIPVLSQLGLHSVRLPNDIIHAPAAEDDEPRQVH